MKNKFKLMIFVLFIAFMSSPVCVWAITTGGTPIIAIDGDSDGNVTVDILSVGGTSTYSYGYFLNGSTAFTALSYGLYGVSTFQGGDIIDFALYDGTKYYTLSGDFADSTYSATITFANEVTVGTPQQPVSWSSPYYYNANITWVIGGISTVNTNSLALNLFSDTGNNGVAPVPEPTTMFLLGSGLVVGLVGHCWRKRKEDTV